jgi:hypothetical protein
MTDIAERGQLVASEGPQIEDLAQSLWLEHMYAGA